MTGTIDMAGAARAWDVIVIGAGPAGSTAARELATRGFNVLLADKSAFPRLKVCGCCLNRRAMDALDRMGLATLPASLGGERLSQLTLVSCRQRRASLPLVGGLAVSRARLDLALVRSAIETGAAFLPDCPATVGERDQSFRRVSLGKTGAQAWARVVIAADGLSGTSLKNLPGFGPRVCTRSRIGVSAVIERPRSDFARHTITMVCGQHGYVGAVHIEGGGLDIAAAVDPGWMKSVGGPGSAVATIFREAKLHADVGEATWRGTPALTRRRAVEAERLLVIGDAAGYVEPFTGEGMAWALIGAEAVARYAAEFVLGGTAHACVSGANWTSIHRSLMVAGHRECWWLSRLLRRPRLASAAIRALAAMPSLATPIVRRINRGTMEAVT